MSFPYPYLRCSHCREQIRFPYPTQREPSANQPRLPTDTWHIMLLCCWCGQWFGVRGRDVNMAQPQTGVRNRWLHSLSFYEITCECVQKGCAVQTKWFVSTTDTLIESEVRKAFEKSNPVPTCEKSHALHFLSAKEVFSLL